MSLVEGYDDTHLLHDGEQFRVWRARRVSDGAAVALKVVCAPAAGSRLEAQLRHEYEVSASLDEHRVARAEALVETRDGVVLVRRYHDAPTLAAWSRGEACDPLRVCEVVSAICEALGSVHRAGVVHRDLKPTNILVDEARRRAWLTDFGISSRLVGGRSAVSDRVVEGTLAYIAPEQTGRMRRAVVPASDLYSLGVVLFELLSGALPFRAEGALEWFHAHLALDPPSLCALRPKLPRALELVVAKLLAKDPDARYQSATGLARDLDRIAEALRVGATIEGFVPAEDDVPERFQRPDFVVGRGDALATLAGAFERVESGGFSAVRLVGEAGAGKTSLIEALRARLSQRARFFSGRHDPSQRAVPSAGLLAIARNALRTMLSEEAVERARWRARVGDALRPNARVLAPVLPELDALLGPCEEPSALGPMESEVRFQLTLRALLCALGEADAPAVLVLDDLHWADEATLRALDGVVTRAPPNTMLILAERGGEGVADEDWRARVAALPTITLGPLTGDGVLALVRRVFPASDEAERALAEVVALRTGGNPFAAVEFLALLADEGIARFNAASRRWSVELPQAATASLPDTVASLVARRLATLDGEDRALLGAVAALGSECEASLLGEVSGCGEARARQALDRAAEAGLVVDAPLGEARRFAHDRVEELAYASLPEPARAPLHARIAAALRDRDASSGDASAVFAIARHDELGSSALGEAERRLAAATARRAARLAREAGAWQAALRHIERAMREDASLREDLALQVERAECAYLGTRFDVLDDAAAAAKALARTDVERARVDEVLVRAWGHRGEHARAMEVALRSLERLGHRFPPAPGPLHVMRALAATRWRLRGLTPDDIERMPRLSDSTESAALALMVSVSASTFFVAPNLFPLLALRIVQSAAAHGVSPETPFGFAAYGLLLAVHFNQLELGFRQGELARRLARRPESAALQGQVEFLFNYFIRHWKAPLRDCADDMAVAARRALELGGLEYWSYNLTGSAATELIRGASLDRLEARVRRDSAALRELKQHKTLVFSRAMEAVIADLRDDPARDALIAETRRGIEGYRAAGDVNGVANLAMLEALRLALRGRAAEALAAAEEGERHIASIAGQVYLPALRFAHALALADSLQEMSPARRAAGHLKLRQLVGAFESWATRSRASYGARALLLRAELARCEGRPREAIARFDEAIAGCDDATSPGDAALVFSRAAMAQQRGGNELIARALAEAAREHALRWGAKAIARELSSRFALDAPQGRARSMRTTTASPVGVVDFESSLKAARAISEEIEMEPLLRRLVELVIENAGARRGVLLTRRGAELFVEAEGVAGGPVTRRERALDLDDSLPRRLIRYVAASAETLLLDDASTSAEFGSDPALRGRTRSVLCAPLLRQGELKGVVYLDHDGAAGVFTKERAEVLRVLAAQAAVSIENARLYAELGAALRRQVSLTEANARFVPREFISSLGRADIDEVRLGDSVQREMTVVFSDMRGFTRHVEGMSPVENISFINDYLSAMEPSILRCGGFVDSYIGDAIMALFAVPAERAVEAAVDMHRSLSAINEARASRGSLPIHIGVGINTGELTLGTIGGPQRIKCGVIGDCVNLAARIESLTKRYGAGVLIGDRTRALLPAGRFELREVDRVRVVGRLAPVTLYEVLDADESTLLEAKRAVSERWSRALAAYEAGALDEALEHFRACAEAVPGDLAAQQRVARCERYLREGAPAPWSGVEDLLEK